MHSWVHGCGDGGSEAQKMLGLLDLSNSTTMKEKSNSGVIKNVHPHLLKIVKPLLVQKLHKEVRLTAGDPGNKVCSLEQCHCWKAANANKLSHR